MDNQNENPLYPRLSEDATLQAMQLIQSFKELMHKAAEEVMADLYTDVLPFIESDAWVNFRTKMVEGFCDYNSAHEQCRNDYAILRQKMFEEYRSEIIKDLQVDLLEDKDRIIKRLQDQVSRLEARQR